MSNNKIEIKEAAKAFRELCQKNQVPMFLAYCTKESGYQYYSLLPGEFEGKTELGDEPDRFLRFMAAAKDYRKENYFPKIS